MFFLNKQKNNLKLRINPKFKKIKLFNRKNKQINLIFRVRKNNLFH